MDYRRKMGRNDENSEDYPMYSRLFIICDRETTENELRNALCEYGNIDDVRIPRDHNTGEPKGIAYVKFSKTSSAAMALEAWNLKVLPNHSRPLKVMVAANRSDIQGDDQDEDKYKRLFINVARATMEEELHEYFSKFGEVTSVNIQRDRETRESKGFAYIRFRRFSEAARAFEEAERKYRAIFALPKGHNKRHETAFESNISSLASTSNLQTSLLSVMNTRPEGYTRVNFLCAPYLTLPHLERIFDIVPGMLRCKFYVDLVRSCGKGTVTYTNPVSAAYAVEKLNFFEYPPGVRMFVKPDDSKFDHNKPNFDSIPDVVSNLKNAISSTANSSTPDLAQLAEAIAEASKLIKAATTGVSDDNGPECSVNYCSVKLPPPQPLADIDSPVAKRCFLVCKPQPPPLTVLRDIFCRFGDLINIYTLPNKTVGYARYASADAADTAIKTLHGAEICGVRMRVMEADERVDDGESSRKKVRIED